VTEIKLPSFGIVVTLTGDGGGAISSDLHEDHELYNAGVDGVEALILAHACAGIDITTPAYLEGIETAVDAIANNTED
jgi:hypothetical protein